MVKFLVTIILLASVLTAFGKKHNTVFVEAESFKNKGGWVVDQQFMDEMGSPYIMAHGMGVAVEDASTTVVFAETG